MISDRGLDLIRSFEGLSLNAYLDTLATQPVWTIGYGETGPHVVEGLVWTTQQAESALKARVQEFCEQVLDVCQAAPNENQLAALTSLAYNIGARNFSRSSVLRFHNARQYAEAAAAFSMWNRAGGKVRAGLTRRRAAEAALYLQPIGDIVQTTRAAPDAKDPGVRMSVGNIAAGAGVALAGAQQAVAQVSAIWDGLGGLGISPHILFAALGVASVGAILWFVFDQRRRRAEGDL